MKNPSSRAQRGNIEKSKNKTIVIPSAARNLPPLNTSVLTSRFLAALVMTLLFILASPLWGDGSVAAQKTNAQIKNVNFELVSDNLIVTYDIVNYKPKEMFTVALNIYTAQENKIKALALSGDINNNISGGDRKKIVWDVKKDSIFIDNDIYVEVVARAQPATGAVNIAVPAITDVPAVGDVTAVPGVPKLPVTTKVKTGKSVNLGKALLLSTIYPGWGDYNSCIHSYKAFWLMERLLMGLLPIQWSPTETPLPVTAITLPLHKPIRETIFTVMPLTISGCPRFVLQQPPQSG